MRVTFSKRRDGHGWLLVVPGRREGLPPVLVKGLTDENFRDAAHKAIADGHKPERP